MHVNYSRMQVHDQITEVFREWKSSTIKKIFQAKTARWSLWNGKKKHERGMDRRNYCSLFFCMKISYFVEVQGRQRTPTALQHKIFLSSLMDPDAQEKRSGHPVVSTLHRKVDNKESQKAFLQGIKQIIWLEIQAQSHSYKVQYHPQWHKHTAPGTITIKFYEKKKVVWMFYVT